MRITEDEVVLLARSYAGLNVRKSDRRRYIPDFLVTLRDGRKLLQEVKGWVRDEEEFFAKWAAAELYCRQNKMTFEVLFEKDLERLMTIP